MRLVRLHKVTSTEQMGVMILRELGVQVSLNNFDEDTLFETLCNRKQRKWKFDLYQNCGVQFRLTDSHVNEKDRL